MAPEVEKRITAAIVSGHLMVMAAKLCAIESDATDALIHYRRRGQRGRDDVMSDKIVECRGIPAVPLKVVNPALRSLLAAGLARLDPLHIGIDVAPTCALLDQFGVPSERLFAVGPLTRAAFWEIVAVPDIRHQCAALATHLSRILSTPRHTSWYRTASTDDLIDRS